jgi:hypothetical protein
VGHVRLIPRVLRCCFNLPVQLGSAPPTCSSYISNGCVRGLLAAWSLSTAARRSSSAPAALLAHQPHAAARSPLAAVFLAHAFDRTGVLPASVSSFRWSAPEAS